MPLAITPPSAEDQLTITAQLTPNKQESLDTPAPFQAARFLLRQSRSCRGQTPGRWEGLDPPGGNGGPRESRDWSRLQVVSEWGQLSRGPAVAALDRNQGVTVHELLRPGW